MWRVAANARGCVEMKTHGGHRREVEVFVAVVELAGARNLRGSMPLSKGHPPMDQLVTDLTAAGWWW